MSTSLKSQHIRLGPHAVKIQIVDDLGARENVFGKVYLWENRIEVAGDITPSQKACTVLHEIAHFIVEHGTASCKKSEHVVEAFERGMVSLLQDNPEFVKLLLEIFREEAARCQVKSLRNRKRTVGIKTRGNRRTRQPKRKRRA